MSIFTKEDIKELKVMFTDMVKDEAKGYIAEEMKTYVPEASKALVKVMMEEVTTSFNNDITPKSAKKTPKKSDFDPDNVDWKDGSVILRLKREDVFTAKTSTVNSANAVSGYVVSVEARTNTLRKCANQHVRDINGICTLYRLGTNRKGEETLYICYGWTHKPDLKGWTKSGDSYVKLLDISAAEQRNYWNK